MTFRVRISQTAQREIDGFIAYASGYSDAWARKQYTRLSTLLFRDLAADPLRYAFFGLTGPPRRACLFRAGSRTKYWIVFTVDEHAQIVQITRFWNGSRNPKSLAGSS